MPDLLQNLLEGVESWVYGTFAVRAGRRGSAALAPGKAFGRAWDFLPVWGCKPKPAELIQGAEIDVKISAPVPFVRLHGASRLAQYGGKVFGA